MSDKPIPKTYSEWTESMEGRDVATPEAWAAAADLVREAWYAGQKAGTQEAYDRLAGKESVLEEIEQLKVQAMYWENQVGLKNEKIKALKQRLIDQVPPT